MSVENAAKRQRLEKQAKGVQESDVGITEYIFPDVSGFTGILKARYSDFQVNEISQENKVVHLTDFGVPLEQNEKKDEEPVAENPKKVETSPEMLEKLRELLGIDLVDKITSLFHSGAKVESDKSWTDKDERTNIHRTCAEAWNNRLETETLPDGRIGFRLATKRQRKPRDRKARGEGEFLRFAVYKENKETMEVASIVAKLLRIPPKSIAFAGTKDRRAVTTQLFSVKGMNASRLSSVNHALKNVYLGNFHHSNEPLRLGDLNGNQFYIALRNVNSFDSVDEALNNLKSSGFINYFGLQRFGTFSVSTHTVGRQILAGDYDGAVNSLLQPQALSSEESAEARAAWQQGDIKKALELMPRRCNAEHSILTCLQESPSSLNAILRIPRNLKLMYVHAYQSYIWNLVASTRIRTHGLNIQEGDLVLAESKDQFERAREVTKEEIQNGDKTIYDVVLPTPGFDVEYPKNLVEIYEQNMQEDLIDCHKMRRNVREFSLSGSYRYLVAKPDNVEWWKTSYADEEDQIIRTDSDLVKENTTDRLVLREDGTQKALILKLDLGSSQYATMALREVMKTDTSRHGELFYGKV